MACHRRERFEELDAHEAGTVAKKKKRKKKVCRRFFSGSMTGFYGFFL